MELRAQWKNTLTVSNSEYSALAKPSDSKLFQLAKARFGHITVFRGAFDKWSTIARELGNWCADQYLIDTLSEKRLRKYEMKVEQKFRGEFARD